MKKLLLASAVAVVSFSTPSFAEGEASVSGGFVSDYFYRGAELGDAAGYASVEYSIAGFTAGVWAIEDGFGTGSAGTGAPTIEYDVYASYGADVSENLSLSIGYTQYNYNYSSDFESEVNLGAAFGPVALDVAIGEDDNGGAGADFDYTYAAVSGDISNISLLLGNYNADLANDGGDYTHFEVSTSKDLGETGASLGVTVGHSNPKASGEDSSEYIFLDLSAGFEF